jgi:hypothetical protein
LAVRATTSSARRLLLSRIGSSADLAETFQQLGWNPTILSTSDGNTALSLAAGGHPQVLVAPLRTDSARSVSLGYSNESTLTVDWGSESLRVYKTSGWMTNPGDRALLEVASEDVTGVAQILSALSRDNYEALASQPTVGRRPPLAEMLARAFAEFRRQAAESELMGGGPGELAALRLFHQLLFMRFHEDRFGVESEMRVRRALDGDDLSRQLARALQWYSRRFNSELFSDLIDPGRVPQLALTEVIRKLVEPWEKLQLDFSVTTNEVAGRLYQSYLRLAPARVDEGRLFPGAELRSLQRQHGAYYTPSPVAGFLIRETLGVWLRNHQPTRFDEVRVIDPTCGSGAFLVAAYRLLLGYWGDRTGRPLSEEERAQILSTSIFGVDQDLAAVMLCRIHLLEEASLAAHVLPELTSNVAGGDSLTGQGLPEMLTRPASFDVVVTNPPFAAPRLAQLKQDFPALVERFVSLRGTGRNLAYAFAELASGLVREGGRTGILLPRALLDGPSSAASRDTLGGEHVAEILDFGRNVVFDYTLAYVAAVVMTHNGSGNTVAARLRDNLVPKADILDDLNQLSLFDQLQHNQALTAIVNMPSENLPASDSWAPFTLRWRMDLRSGLTVKLQPLGARGAPEVVIGTQSGADDRFVLGPDVYTSRAGEIVLGGLHIPEALAPFWVKGEDILPFRVRISGRRVVIPQQGRHGSVDAYIAQQGGVPTSFRAGQLEQLRRPKVLVRNLFLEPAAGADLTGELMPPQGVVTALVPRSESSEDVLYVEGLLNSSLYQWLLQGLAHPRAGGFGRLMAHHWNDVPWPILSRAAQRKVVKQGGKVRGLFAREADDSDRLGGAKITDAYWRARHELDECVLDSLGASERLRRVISRELWRLA